MKIIAKYLLPLLLLISGGALAEETAVNYGQSVAVCVANKHAQEKFPDFFSKYEIDEIQIFVKDVGASFEVAYGPPPDWLGGGPVVVVNKKTKKVERTFSSQ